MGQLRTANKSRKRAIVLLQARKAPVEVPATVAPKKAASKKAAS